MGRSQLFLTTDVLFLQENHLWSFQLSWQQHGQDLFVVVYLGFLWVWVKRSRIKSVHVHHFDDLSATKAHLISLRLTYTMFLTQRVIMTFDWFTVKFLGSQSLSDII